MNQKQYELDRDSFGFFLDESGEQHTNPRAAIDCIAETMLESIYPGTEWLDKTIDLLFDGYIKNYPRPGTMMKHLLVVIAKYFEVRDIESKNSRIFENLGWWFITAEGHFKWLIEEFAEEDEVLRWSLRLIFRRYLRHAERSGVVDKFAYSFAHTQLLNVDPAFQNDATVIFVDPPKVNPKIYSFIAQRPFRFKHDVCPTK